MRCALGLSCVVLLALHAPAALRAAEGGVAARVAPVDASPAVDVARADETPPLPDPAVHPDRR